MKHIFRNILSFGFTSAILGSATYTYVAFQTGKNKKLYEQTLEANTLRDASRLTNVSFGISWGFQADDIIMNRIDTGDLIFIKYDCWECLNPSQCFQCLRESIFLLEEDFQTVAVAYRNQSGLKALYNEFGTTKIIEYTDLVGLPYIKELIIQKSKNTLSVQQKLRNILQKQEKQGKVSSINFINGILLKLGIRPVNNFRELMTESDQINVRTNTNKSLRSL